ncbi:MAG: efflux RND transporter periplasmic adaptor subunit [Planctomycetota bacterium]
MNTLRWTLNTIVALVVLAIAGLLAWWMIVTKPGAPQQEAQPIVPNVLAPSVEPMRDYAVRVVGFGSVRPKVSVDVTPQVSGEIIYKHPAFFSGEPVTKGQILFKIDPTDYALARDVARDEIRLLEAKLEGLNVTEANLNQVLKIERDRLELAQRDLARAEELIKRNAASQTEIDRARETVLARQLQIQLLANKLADIPPQRVELEAQKSVNLGRQRQAETDLARTEYRSPFNGRVIDCPLQTGERVQAGQNCGSIYATDTMEIPVPLSTGDLKWLKRSLLTDPDAASAGIEAEVAWQADPSAEPVRWTGRAARLEAGLAAKTRTATVVVEVANPSAGDNHPTLDINMFTRVTILGSSLPEAFSLPRRAIQPDGSVYIVTDIAPDESGAMIGRLGRRPVTVARYTDSEAMILPGDGLEAGDRVAIDYIPKPVLGMQVRPVDRYDQARSTPNQMSPADDEE